MGEAGLAWGGQGVTARPRPRLPSGGHGTHCRWRPSGLEGLVFVKKPSDNPPNTHRVVVPKLLLKSWMLKNYRRVVTDSRQKRGWGWGQRRPAGSRAWSPSRAVPGLQAPSRWGRGPVLPCISDTTCRFRPASGPRSPGLSSCVLYVRISPKSWVGVGPGGEGGWVSSRLLPPL